MARFALLLRPPAGAALLIQTPPTLATPVIVENAATGTIISAIVPGTADVSYALIDTFGARVAFSGGQFVVGATRPDYEDSDPAVINHTIVPVLRCTKAGYATIDVPLPIAITNQPLATYSVAPSIGVGSGGLKVGQAITFSPGTTNGTQQDLRLEISADGSTAWAAVSGGSPYTILGGDLARYYRLRSRAVNTDGDLTTVYSNVTGPVAEAATGAGLIPKTDSVDSGVISFTGTDGTLATSLSSLFAAGSLGNTSGFVIGANGLNCQNNSTGTYCVETNSTDHFVEAVIRGYNIIGPYYNEKFFLRVDISADGASYIELRIHGSGEGAIGVFQIVGAATTQLIGSPNVGTMSQGSNVRFEANKRELRILVDGELRYSLSRSFSGASRGTRAGVGAPRSADGYSGSNFLDNLRAGSIATPLDINELVLNDDLTVTATLSYFGSPAPSHRPF